MKKKILLIQFFIILFLTGTMESIIAGIMPFISSEYQVSDSITGQLTTIYTGIFAIFGPILVFSLRQYQSKLIYLLSLVLFGISNLLVYSGGPLLILFLSRILCALSASVVVAKTLEMCFHVFHNDKKKLAIVNMGFSASIALGVPFGTFISGLTDWKIIFLFTGLSSLLLAISLFGMLNLNYKVVLNRKENALKDIFIKMCSFKNLRLLLTTMLILLANMAIYGYIAPFLVHMYQFTTQEISHILFIAGIGGVIGSYLSSYLMNKLGIQKSLILSISLFACSLMLLAFKLPIYLLYIVIFIGGICQWATGPIIQYELSSSSDENVREQLISLNMSALNIGSSIGSAIGGLFISYTSISNLPLLASLFAGIALLNSLFLRK